MRHSITLGLTLVLLFSGCVEKEILAAEDLYAGPRNMEYNYTVWGAGGSIKMIVYRGLNDHLANISRLVYCRPNCPSNESIQQRYLDDLDSDPQLSKLLFAVKERGKTRSEQAFIAISLVQNIPYDESSYEEGRSKDRYPYQVLYENKALCGEKVRLLAYLLRGLGYDTSMLYYPKEKHASLGVSALKNTHIRILDTASSRLRLSPFPPTIRGIIPGPEGSFRFPRFCN
jgi:hypothetical protein